jgi:proteasome lid subunit RPN8/RPN11
MIQHAQTELPNECCGLFAGRLEGDVGRVEKRYPLVNAAEDPTREYLGGAERHFAAERDMRLCGFELLAIYHSHPTSAPIPSRKDLASNAYGPDIVDIIVGLAGAEPEVRAWRLTNADYREAAWEVLA